MADDDIQWGPPPTVARSRIGHRGRFVEALKSRPGEWAKYPTAMSNAYANDLKKAYPGLEVTQRSRPDSRYDVYARWVG